MKTKRISKWKKHKARGSFVSLIRYIQGRKKINCLEMESKGDSDMIGFAFNAEF